MTVGDSIENDGTLALDQHDLDALHGVTYREIAAWGDSLTAGNVAGLPNAYPTLLSADFGGDRVILNEGVGGQTSAQIADRMTAATNMLGDTAIIWAGRNSLTQGIGIIEADVARMVSGSNTHFVVLSVLNGESPQEIAGQSVYKEIQQLNNDLASKYVGRYLDVRTLLVNAYDPHSTEDVQDYANDVVPTSLRVDALHLNRAGNTIVANALQNFITTQLDGPPPPVFTIDGTGTIETSDTRFDLRNVATTDNTIVSTSTVGTTFLTDNVNTSMHIVGSTGFDVVSDVTDTLSDEQIGAVLSHGIEEIVDQSGAHFAAGAIPQPVIVGLANATGTQSSSCYAVTSSSSPIIVGTSAPNTLVRLYKTVAGVATYTGQAAADAGGHWTYTLQSTDGTAWFFAKATDQSGSEFSQTSSPFRITVDTVAPDAPIVGRISPDTGSSTTDGITKIPHIHFTGTAEGFSTVEVYVDGALLGVTRAKSANWGYYNPSIAFADGTHQVSAIAVDAAGNRSSVSSPRLFTVDTHAPAAVSGLSIGNASISRGVFTTQSRSLLFSGQAEANSQVRISLGAHVVGTTSVNGSGNWSFTDSPVANGHYTFSARDLDAAGNLGASSAIRVLVNAQQSSMNVVA